MTSCKRRYLALGSVVLALGLLGLSAGSALAANTRFATPGGSGAQPCEETAPCALPKALTGTGANGVADGDRVILLPGTYHPGEALEVEHPIEVSGQPGAARPLIDLAGGFGLDLKKGGSFVHDLRIDQEFGVDGLLMLGGGTVERVYVGAGTEAPTACALFHTVVRDTVCWSTAPTGAGIRIQASGAATVDDTFHNVTAVGAVGIKPEAGFGTKIIVNAVNTIASGSSQDVEATTDMMANTSATVTLTNSNFSTTKGVGPSISITPPGSATNQTAKPLFVNAATGDFHQAAGSPTIGAGDLSVVQSGELDLDLAPRTSADACGRPSAVDIGAYQSAIVPTCPPPPPGPAPKKTKPAPKLSSFSLSPSHFGAAGTTLRFKLSARAKVTIGVWRVRPKHKLGSLHLSGHQGKNKVHFSGRVAGHSLTPGKYQLRVYATSNGKRSRTLSKGFEVTG